MATAAQPLFPLGKIAELSCDLTEPSADVSHSVMMNIACAPGAKGSFARWYKPFMEPSHAKLQGAVYCTTCGTLSDACCLESFELVTLCTHILDVLLLHIPASCRCNGPPC